MHPDVCAAGVAAVLRRPAAVARRASRGARSLDGVAPGVRVLTVDHDGNSTDSPEEADAIVAEIAAAARHRRGPTSDGTVAARAAARPGRHPVQRAGGDAAAPARRRGADRRARSGTVDKFQGRQAPVVFVSMTASSADDVPRGISFLLNRNRLNVAVSRAKYAAVIVRSPLLTDYLPSTPDRPDRARARSCRLAPSCDTPTG